MKFIEEFFVKNLSMWFEILFIKLIELLYVEDDEDDLKVV